jgi:hypothetical protein
MIVIELHDRFKAGCRQALELATKEFVETQIIGEHIILSRATHA